MNLFDVYMTKNDLDFYEGQKSNPPLGYCEGYVDRKWKLCQERKQARANRARSEHYEFYRENAQCGDEAASIPQANELCKLALALPSAS